MKNLTPQHLRCEWGGCPSVHELEDGRRYIIVGQTAGLVADDELVAKPGPDETAVIIDHALLSTIRDEVREECAEALRQMRWSKDAFPMRLTTWKQEDAHAAIGLALESAVAAIRALTETPHE
jgi:hypothetical protein